MHKQLEIKVCGNTNQRNLDAVNALQPDYLGFIFYPKSKRYVEAGNALQSLNSNAKRVGVFVSPMIRDVAEKVETHRLDFIQLHGDETPEFCAKINEIRPVFKVFQINNLFKFAQVNDYKSVSYRFLFDTSSQSYGGSGKKFDWALLSEYKADKPFFLSGGIHPEDINEILSLDHPQLAGVDLNSGFEVSPGIKDIDKLSEFFKQLRNL